MLKYENKLYNYKHINIIISYTTQTYLTNLSDKKQELNCWLYKYMLYIIKDYVIYLKCMIFC